LKPEWALVNDYFYSGKIPAMKTAPYHHGALREALLSAAETILKRDGLNALTLRAAAREAGVTHAAPSHHFGDLTGLLTELAADGFRRFAARLQAVIEAPDARRWDGARAYIAFATENPALFQLMFRSERLDGTRAAFKEARMQILGILSESRGVSSDKPTLEQLGKMMGGWSLIHGYTMLLLDGRLKPLLNIAPDGTTMDELFEAMLVATDRQEIGPKSG
jgi:AcrR family transcriptional regulator